MVDLYAISIAPYLRGLTVLLGLLEKAAGHAEAHKVEPHVLLWARLYPDMFPFAGQVQIACDHANRGTARLLGIEAPRHEDVEQSFGELQQRIASTADFVAGHRRDAFAGREAHAIELMLGDQLRRLTAVDYLTWFSLPNFHFHITTAYDILRHNGVLLSKRDYLDTLPEPSVP